MICMISRWSRRIESTLYRIFAAKYSSSSLLLQSESASSMSSSDSVMALGGIMTGMCHLLSFVCLMALQNTSRQSWRSRCCFVSNSCIEVPSFVLLAEIPSSRLRLWPLHLEMCRIAPPRGLARLFDLPTRCPGSSKALYQQLYI